MGSAYWETWVISNGWAFWAWCGWFGPAYTFSFFSIWRPRRFLGSMPHTAFSIARRGSFSSSSPNGVAERPPGPMPMMATYAATKTFELSFTEALADELEGAPVDVLLFCPGATRTEFFRRAHMPDSFLRYAEHPDAVARKALAALGRTRVQVSRGSIGLALSTIAVPRRIVAAGAKRFIQRIAGHAGS